jgi:hypothetical protein
VAAFFSTIKQQLKPEPKASLSGLMVYYPDNVFTVFLGLFRLLAVPAVAELVFASFMVHYPILTMTSKLSMLGSLKIYLRSLFKLQMTSKVKVTLLFLISLVPLLVNTVITTWGTSVLPYSLRLIKPFEASSILSRESPVMFQTICPSLQRFSKWVDSSRELRCAGIECDQVHALRAAGYSCQGKMSDPTPHDISTWYKGQASPETTTVDLFGSRHIESEVMSLYSVQIDHHEEEIRIAYPVNVKARTKLAFALFSKRYLITTTAECMRYEGNEKEVADAFAKEGVRSFGQIGGAMLQHAPYPIPGSGSHTLVQWSKVLTPGVNRFYSLYPVLFNVSVLKGTDDNYKWVPRYKEPFKIRVREKSDATMPFPPLVLAENSSVFCALDLQWRQSSIKSPSSSPLYVVKDTSWINRNVYLPYTPPEMKLWKQLGITSDSFKEIPLSVHLLLLLCVALHVLYFCLKSPTLSEVVIRHLYQELDPPSLTFNGHADPNTKVLLGVKSKDPHPSLRVFPDELREFITEYKSAKHYIKEQRNKTHNP